MRIWGAAAAAAIIIACLTMSGCVTRVVCPAPPVCPPPPAQSFPTIVPNIIQTPCTDETCGRIRLELH